MTKANNALTEEERFTKSPFSIQPRTIFNHISNKYMHIIPELLRYTSQDMQDTSHEHDVGKAEGLNTKIKRKPPAYYSLVVGKLTKGVNMGLITRVGIGAGHMIRTATATGTGADHVVYIVTSQGMSFDTDKVFPYDTEAAILEAFQIQNSDNRIKENCVNESAEDIPLSLPFPPCLPLSLPPSLPLDLPPSPSSTPLPSPGGKPKKTFFQVGVF